MRQVGTRKTYQKRSVGLYARRGVAVEASKDLGGIETGGPAFTFGMSLLGARLLGRWCPAQGGVSLVCGFCTEHEKASVDTSAVHLGLYSHPVERGSVPRKDPEGTEYRCGARRRTGSQ